MTNNLDFRDKGGYTKVNKPLEILVGTKESVFLCELYGKYLYYKENNKLTLDGYFYCTVEDIRLTIGLSDGEQRTIITHLQQNQLLDMKHGKGKVRYFKLNLEEINRIIDKYIEQSETKEIESVNNCDDVRSKESLDLEIENIEFQNSRIPTEIKINNKNKHNTNIEEVEDKQIEIIDNYKLLEDLEINELQELGNLVMENRDKDSNDISRIDYSVIQKRFYLLDRVSYNTPSECAKLIRKKRKQSFRIISITPLVNQSERTLKVSDEVY